MDETEGHYVRRNKPNAKRKMGWGSSGLAQRVKGLNKSDDRAYIKEEGENQSHKDVL